MADAPSLGHLALSGELVGLFGGRDVVAAVGRSLDVGAVVSVLGLDLVGRVGDVGRIDADRLDRATSGRRVDNGNGRRVGSRSRCAIAVAVAINAVVHVVETVERDGCHRCERVEADWGRGSLGGSNVYARAGDFPGSAQASSIDMSVLIA